MWKSLGEYANTLGYWGLIVTAPIALDVLGIYQVATNTQVLGVPPWVWIVLALILFLFIPFIAFHRVRIRLQNVTGDRERELARLILQVRNAAAKVVLYHVTNGLTDEVRKLHIECKDAQSLLNIEGEVDGGKIKEIVYGFTAFVGIHVARLLGWSERILESDKNTVQQIEMDEYRFCGRMADRAAEAILNIHKAFKR